MKCPKSSIVHMQRWVDRKVPDEYIAQVQGNLWVTGRQWADFVSYDPRAPESHRLLIIPVRRDEAYIKELADTVNAAEAEVQRILAVLREGIAA
jgi:predicted phage-related endonuclease